MYNEMNKTGYVAQRPLFTVSKYTPTEIDDRSKVIEQGGLARLTAVAFAWHHVLFRNHVWTLLLGISGISMIFYLWKTKLRSNLAISILLLLMSTLSYMVVVSVNIAMIRYNQPMHIVTYLVPLITIAMIGANYKGLKKSGSKIYS
jgi:membrane-associated HD superfamily phosphohydrolase